MSIQQTKIDLLNDTKQFQFIMDGIAETFEQPIWANYLTDRFTLDLTWQQILGVMENSPAASVIEFGSGKPVAVRPTVSKLNGDLFSFGNKYPMTPKKVREFYELQDKVNSIGINTSDLINFLYPDLQRATLGPHKAIDRLLLEAISTGQMTLTAALNPKGIILNEALDWGITKEKVATVWTTAATATPLADIRKVVDTWIDKGVEFKLMKMSRATFNLMVATTEFKNAFRLEMGMVKAEKPNLLGVNNVNLFLEAIDLPTIELINYPVSIEKKDGTYTTVRPFADNRVSFSVDNNYGEMVRTYSNQERSPNKMKSYANSLNVLIAKYQDLEGNEITENEFNAFPVLNKANSMAILTTDVAA
jgi:hypothetical protein